MIYAFALTHMAHNNKALNNQMINHQMQQLQVSELHCSSVVFDTMTQHNEEEIAFRERCTIKPFIMNAVDMKNNQPHCNRIVSKQMEETKKKHAQQC